MEYKKINPIKIIGFSSTNTFLDDAQKSSTIWKKFLSIKSKNPYLAKQRVYSISKSITQDFSFENPNSKFKKIIGLSQEDAPQLDVEFFEIEGGEYGKFYHKGKADDFPETLKKILHSWLPEEGVDYDYTRSRFEVLEGDYSPFDENAVEEVWIPIKKR